MTVLPMLLALCAVAQESPVDDSEEVYLPEVTEAGPAVDPLALAPATPLTLLPIHGDPWDVSVTGYVIPPRKVEWLTSEDPVQHCDVQVRWSVGTQPAVTPDEACSEPWAADAELFTSHWTFEPLVPELAGGETTFRVRYLARYARELSELTVFATVDPGHDLAFAGLQGVPGVKLVHPADTRKVKDPKLPKHLRGVEVEPCLVDLLVDGAGVAHDVRPFSCPEDLAELAVSTVSKKWRFTPLVVDGVTQPEEIRIEVRFRE